MKICFVCRSVDVETLNDGVEMVSLAANWDSSSNDLVKRHTTNRVLRLEDQVGQAGRDCGTVFVFVERAVSILHAVGDINQQVAAHVGVFFKLLDVQSVLPRPDLPIDVSQVVAGNVFAVLQKFDGLTEIRAAMHPRKKTFDDMLRPQIQSRNSLDRFRMQKSSGIWHRLKVRLLWMACYQSVAE